MKIKKKISPKNLPTRIPVFATITICLVLDRLNAHPLIWGAILTFMALILIVSTIMLYKEKHVNIFKEKNVKKLNDEINV